MYVCLEAWNALCVYVLCFPVSRSSPFLTRARLTNAAIRFRDSPFPATRTGRSPHLFNGRGGGEEQERGI